MLHIYFIIFYFIT